MRIVDSIFRTGKKTQHHVPDEQRIARGKEARRSVRRSTQRELDMRGRPDPITLLEEQARTRVPELVPIRHGRMMASPFAFFRGAALVMASDLARTPTSGLQAQLCGDAHLMNFGVFGTPERSLVFDINDFDETLPGPWEWDVKRLAASLEIAARSIGFSKPQRHEIVVDALRCYRETMAGFAVMRNLDVWYAHLNVEQLVVEFRDQLTRHEVKTSEKLIEKALEQDSAHALDKLTEYVGGVRQIISRPPMIVPIRELLSPNEQATTDAWFNGMLDNYSKSLPPERRVLFEQYHLVEVARKVVGVGSVGTHSWIVLFSGVDNDDPLFLQVKEAEASVLERFVGASKLPQHGERVVSGQRLMQASSDILLGWLRTTGIDGRQRDFYLRQLRDWKASIAVENARPAGLSVYGRLCGWTLARAHARSGERVAIASYLGKNDIFDEAVATFAVSYADQTERDHAALLQAIRSGRLAAETGV